MTSFKATAAVLGVLATAACADKAADSQAPSESPAAISAPETPQSGIVDQAADPASSGDDSAPTQGETALRPSAAPRTEPSRPADRSANATPPAAAPGAAPAAEWREITVPAGTTLNLELQTSLSSETAKVETPVRARFRSPVVVDGYTVIPSGSIASGTVTAVDRPGRVKGRARLVLAFTEVQVNGARETLRTEPITFVGEETKGDDAAKIGGGAIGGAIIGGLLGGGDGAAKGAAIGGAAGTGAVLATRGKDVTVAAGTDLSTTLASPTEITVAAR
jgi:hypothetical protein